MKLLNSNAFMILIMVLIAMTFACRTVVVPVERILNDEVRGTQEQKLPFETGRIPFDDNKTASIAPIRTVEANQQANSNIQLFTSAITLTQLATLTKPISTETPSIQVLHSATTVIVHEVMQSPIPDYTRYMEPYTEPGSEPPEYSENPAVNLDSNPSSTPIYEYETKDFSTASPTVLPSSTAITAPPWIAAALSATDPSRVELASGKVQLVEFFAFWCGTCQAMASVIRQLEERYQDNVNFVYLDIDNPENYAYKKILRYRKQPHFLLLDSRGKTIQQWMGYAHYEEFANAIEKELK